MGKYVPAGWKPSSEEEKETFMRADLELKTVSMLTAICEEENVKVKSRAKKQDIIDAIIEKREEEGKLKLTEEEKQSTVRKLEKSSGGNVAKWEMGEKKSIFDVLPKVLLKYIIGFTGFAEYPSLSLTCRFFHECASEDATWKRFFFEKWPEEGEKISKSMHAAEKKGKKRKREEEEEPRMADEQVLEKDAGVGNASIFAHIPEEARKKMKEVVEEYERKVMNWKKYFHRKWLTSGDREGCFHWNQMTCFKLFVINKEAEKITAKDMPKLVKKYLDIAHLKEIVRIFGLKSSSKHQDLAKTVAEAMKKKEIDINQILT